MLEAISGKKKHVWRLGFWWRVEWRLWRKHSRLSRVLKCVKRKKKRVSRQGIVGSCRKEKWVCERVVLEELLNKVGEVDIVFLFYLLYLMNDTLKGMHKCMSDVQVVILMLNLVSYSVCIHVFLLFSWCDELPWVCWVLEFLVLFYFHVHCLGMLRNLVHGGIIWDCWRYLVAHVGVFLACIAEMLYICFHFFRGVEGCWQEMLSGCVREPR